MSGQPKWTRDQQRALDARGHTVLVSAAAGSGKTAGAHRACGAPDARSRRPRSRPTAAGCHLYPRRRAGDEAADGQKACRADCCRPRRSGAPAPAAASRPGADRHYRFALPRAAAAELAAARAARRLPGGGFAGAFPDAGGGGGRGARGRLRQADTPAFRQLAALLAERRGIRACRIRCCGCSTLPAPIPSISAGSTAR